MLTREPVAGMRDLEAEAAVGEAEDVVARDTLAPRVRDDDHLELEPLGGVDRQQPDGVRALLLRDGVALRRADRVLLGDEADEALDVGPAQLLERAREAGELAEVGVATLPVAPREDGEVVVVLDEDALAEQLQGEPRRALDEPLVPLQERAHEATVVVGEVGGSVRSIPLKIGRFSALARMRTSASFETPTNGDASTVSSASSS